MTFQLPAGPFALLRRADATGIEVFTGPVGTADRLGDIPLPGDATGPATLALVPYRQVAERGFDCVDDAMPLEYLRITGATTADLDEVLAGLPTTAPPIHSGRFDRTDDEYAAIVDTVLREEIGRGEGSNFVIHRVFEANVTGDPVRAALSAYARLLRDECGAYWTFCVHTGARTLVGATPERHVSVDDGLVMMNPISGTYRHPPTGPDHAGLLRFFADRKEADELYMVLDEELKMMAVVADDGGQVIGPYLKRMAHLHHTEYLLAGRGSLDVREVLRETMFAPTVVGSPIENACRVIARHERRGRRYYGAVLALLGRDDAGRQTLDAPILIRTAEIDAAGRLRVPVGATLVRHSTPAGEVAETHAKAAAILAALGLAPPARPAPPTPPTPPTPPAPPAPGDPGGFDIDFDAESSTIAEALAARNTHLARFWLDQRDASAAEPALRGVRALIVDGEDTFTGMLAHQLRALGLTVERRDYRTVSATNPDAADLLIAGPGPGDPTAPDDPKMVTLRTMIAKRLAARRPLLGICLGHQLIAGLLGLRLRRRDAPYQGTQREIDFFGRPERVGYYSTFTVLSAASAVETAAGPVTISRDPVSHEVYALRGATFAGVPFHPESVLSEHGIELLRELLLALAGTPKIGRR